MPRKLWLLLLLASVSLSVSTGTGAGTRHFAFQYGFTVKDVPPGAHIRVWIPAAHSDEFQEVRVISANRRPGAKENS